MKNNNKKGFTLMELLIVIAIIVVLVAIAIPVFGGQLTKAKETTDIANLRSAYAEQQTAILSDNKKLSDVKTVFTDMKKTGDTTLNYSNLLVVTDVAATETTPAKLKIEYKATKVTGQTWTFESASIN